MADKKAKDTGFAANWRPDFRNTEALPDVKAVRTNFLVNFMALALAIIITGWFGFKEYEAMSVQAQIDGHKDTISQASKANNANLKLSKEFSKLSPKAEDLQAFYDGYKFPLDVLVALCESRPTTISLQNMSFGKVARNTGTAKRPKFVYAPRYTLQGLLKGDSVEALQELDEYKEILGNLEIFEGQLSPNSIDISQPKRNPELEMFEFTIVITLNEAK